tara:strand:+ start:68 stop:745 length:678 start_codon:yes stop_codon:yes gene_type:complete
MAITILCPKKCGDVLIGKRINSTNRYINPIGIILLFVPILMIIALLFIPTIIPKLIALGLIEVYLFLFVILLVLALKYSTKPKKEPKNASFYVCPTCEGVFISLEAIKQVSNASRITINRRVKDNIDKLMEVLTSSVVVSELKCVNCTKSMNSVQVPYTKIRSDVYTGNAIIDILGTAALIADEIANPDAELHVEGCKRCNVFWFDKSELSKLKEPYSFETKRNL